MVVGGMVGWSVFNVGLSVFCRVCSGGLWWGCLLEGGRETWERWVYKQRSKTCMVKGCLQTGNAVLRVFQYGLLICF